MLEGQRIAVVMPAYNAQETLNRVLADLPLSSVDQVILVDDASRDRTAEMATTLGLKVIRHRKNLGYGGNQKTCYAAAIESGADIIVMLHPDYQYAPKLVGALAWMLISGEYDIVLGSRILGGGSRKGGMPAYKYFANRALTAFQNLMMGTKLSEFHTGYRAFNRSVLEHLPLGENSDDFVFDNQILAQAAHFGLRIGEISCPTRYFPEASSINFRRSLIYGVGVVKTSIAYRLSKWGLYHHAIFSVQGKKLSSRRLTDDAIISLVETEPVLLGTDASSLR